MAETGITFTAQAPNITQNTGSRVRYATGTIQQVLDELAANNVRAGRLVSYTDDGTNATAVYDGA